VTALSNGVKVVSHNNGSPSSSVGAFFNVGSANENANNNGITYLLNNVLLQGSKTRQAKALASDIESLGGSLKNSVERQQSSFVVSTLNKDLPRAMEILSDLVVNADISEAKLAATKQTLNDLSDGRDQRKIIMDHMNSIAFQRGSLAFTPEGSKETRDSVKLSDVQAWARDYFTGSRLVIAASGGVNHDDLVKLADTTFSKLPQGQYSPQTVSPYTGSMLTIRDDLVHKVYAVLALPGVGIHHNDYYTIKLMMTILGGYDSRIGDGATLVTPWTERFSDDSLVNVVDPFVEAHRDTGVFGFWFDTEHYEILDLDAICSGILKSFHEVRAGVGPKHLERAKTQLKMKIANKLGSNECMAKFLSFEKKESSIEEIFQRIDDISAKEVSAAAETYAVDQEPTAVNFGSVSGWPDYLWLRRYVSGFRF